MITHSKLKSHLEGFRRYMEGKNYSPAGIVSYVGTVRRFLISNAWGDEFKFADFLAYFGTVSQSHLAASMKKSMLVHLKRYYDYLAETGYRNDHPCQNFVFQEAVDRSVIQSDLFTMDELETIMNMEAGWGRMPWKNKTVISLLIYQALAGDEIINLKMGDIDLDRGTVTIRSGKKRTRELELKPRQYGILHHYINEERVEWLMEDTDRLIINHYGKAASIIRHSFDNFRQLYPDRDLSPTTMRGSVISYWLNVLKLPMEQVQLMAGLKWISSIERYQHLTKDEEQEMLRQFHPLG